MVNIYSFSYIFNKTDILKIKVKKEKRRLRWHLKIKIKPQNFINIDTRDHGQAFFFMDNPVDNGQGSNSMNCLQWN